MRHQITQWGHEAWVGPDGVHFSDYGSLEELARTAPHDCDVPGCPGPLNQRKLEVFEGLLDSLERLIDNDGGCLFTGEEPEETCPGENDPHYGMKCPWCQAHATIKAAAHGSVLEADAARMDPAAWVAADAGRLAEAETAQEAARSPQAR